MPDKGCVMSEESRNKISEGVKKFWSTRVRIPHPNMIKANRKRMMGNLYRRGKKMPTSALKKLSKINHGSGNSNWRGGLKIDKSGYRMIWTDTHPCRDAHNYYREHRWVVELFIGRYLKPMESVHHIDLNKGNNSPLNLMAFINHAEHNRFEKDIEVSKEKIIFDGRNLKSVSGITKKSTKPRREYVRKINKSKRSTSK